jgi:hypothetical protein
MSETSLHAALKKIYAGENGLTEATVGPFLVDVLHDQEIIEIQTRNFAALVPKLTYLLPTYRVRLVHPIAETKWIITHLPESPLNPRRRRSPARGQAAQILAELSPIADLLSHPNLVVETIPLEVEEYRAADGKGSWRRKGISIQDRRLVRILNQHQLEFPAGYLDLIPANLPFHFTRQDFARLTRLSSGRAAKALYFLRRLNLITIAGKKGRAFLYQRPEFNPVPSCPTGLIIPSGDSQ